MFFCVIEASFFYHRSPQHTKNVELYLCSIAFKARKMCDNPLIGQVAYVTLGPREKRKITLTIVRGYLTFRLTVTKCLFLNS